MTEALLRAFLSSPADVADERRRALAVVQRLNVEFQGRVRIDLIRWEDAFFSAARSFQEAIDEAVADMSATDLVVCVVWKRVGTPLDPDKWRRPDGSSYESGTVLEVEQALAVRRSREAPDIYLFKKTEPVLYASWDVDAERAQHALLEAVWKRWTQTPAGHNVAGYQTFSTPDDFAEKLDACMRQWLARRGFLAEGPVWDRIKGSPFPGLMSFDESRSSIFFGRDLAVAEAVGRLRDAGRDGASFLLVIGASGAGKSSLLRAGILPRLTSPGAVPDVDLWRRAVVTQGADPLAALAQALFTDEALGAELRQGDFDTPEKLARQFGVLVKPSGDGDAPHPHSLEAAIAPVARALERAAASRADAQRYDQVRAARLALGVDQTERLFLESDPARTTAFAHLLAALVTGRFCFAVMSLRSDAYGAYQNEPALLALLRQGATLDLVPPSLAELREIVTRPVAACRPRLAFEQKGGRSLADVLVADAKGGDALPILQLTLARLYAAETARGDGVLRFDDYRGISAAVTETAEEALGLLGAEARNEVPALVASLVRDVAVDHATGALVAVVAPIDRHAFLRGQAAREELIDAFVARRLLTSEGDGASVKVRPVHEALLRLWPEAVALVAETGDLIRVRRTLEPMVREWRHADATAKSAHVEISPALLDGAKRLQARFGPDLPHDMLDFIAAVAGADRARRDHERRRQRRMLVLSAMTNLLIALVAVVVLASIRLSTKAAFDAQVFAAIEADSQQLAENYASGGLRRLVQLINDRSRQPGSHLYLVTNAAGEPLTGNVAAVPEGLLSQSSRVMVESSYERAGDAGGEHHALIRLFDLPSGFKLLVGSDLGDRDRLIESLGRVLVMMPAVLLLIGLASAIVVWWMLRSPRAYRRPG